MTGPAAAVEWRLCWTTPTKRTGRYLSPLLDGWDGLEETEQALGIRPGQPFLLSPDGTGDPDVLAYFNSRAFRDLAKESQRAYAIDLKVFLSFLSGQSVSWRDATEDDMLDFKFWRRQAPENPARVSAAKFGRELAACGKFFRWQVARGVIERNPIAVDATLTARSGKGSRAELAPKDARSVRVKWMTPRAYRRWRDVGLGGYDSDGRRQPGWRGRNDGRNVAMADLLWSSGLRLREAGTLLTLELPVPNGREQYLRGRVAEAVAKGSGRDFWVSRRALAGIDAYRKSTRASAIRKAQRAGRYDDVEDAMIVERVTASRDVFFRYANGGPTMKASLDAMDHAERARLFQSGEHGLEPVSLWLTEFGTPLPYRTWEAVFDNANDRCLAQGVDMRVHPHMLRHSFALRMLVTLFHAFDRRMGLSEDDRREYRLILGDPWVMVQTMLGHANVSTTKSYYLEPVKGLQIDLFLNADDDESDTLDDLMTKVAAASPLIVDGPGSRA